MTEIRKYGAVVQVSRTELLDLGLVEPTPAERAAREAEGIEWERRRQAEKQAIAAFATALEHVTDPVARAVLDLHKEDHGICDAERDFDGYGSMWPCQTVVTVATTLGIPVPEHLQ